MKSPLKSSLEPFPQQISSNYFAGENWPAGKLKPGFYDTKLMVNRLIKAGVDTDLLKNTSVAGLVEALPLRDFAQPAPFDAYKQVAAEPATPKAKLVVKEVTR